MILLCEEMQGWSAPVEQYIVYVRVSSPQQCRIPTAQHFALNGSEATLLFRCGSGERAACLLWCRVTPLVALRTAKHRRAMGVIPPCTAEGITPRVLKMTHGNFFRLLNSSHNRIYIVNIEVIYIVNTEVIGIFLSSYTLFSYDLLNQFCCTTATSQQSKSVCQITDKWMWSIGRLISDNEVPKGHFIQKNYQMDCSGNQHGFCIYFFNPLKTKWRLLYLKTQSVPRCKHFSSRL